MDKTLPQIENLSPRFARRTLHSLDNVRTHQQERIVSLTRSSSYTTWHARLPSFRPSIHKLLPRISLPHHTKHKRLPGGLAWASRLEKACADADQQQRQEGGVLENHEAVPEGDAHAARVHHRHDSEASVGENAAQQRGQVARGGVEPIQLAHQGLHRLLPWSFLHVVRGDACQCDQCEQARGTHRKSRKMYSSLATYSTTSSSDELYSSGCPLLPQAIADSTRKQGQVRALPTMLMI